MIELPVRLRGTKHAKAQAVRTSKAKRRIMRCGRRSSKTTTCGQIAIDGFMAGRRVLYGGPTSDQLNAFWFEITRAFADAVSAGKLRKNETEHFIEVPGTKHRIRAKTVWDADTLRGDYTDLLILDECQMVDEGAWTEVGLPMLADNNGDAVLAYTPPSVYSLAESKAKDPRWISRLFEAAQKEMELAAKEGRPSRWEAFHFSSHDNPYISREGLDEIAKDMTALAYRQEILAEDINEVPGAMWTRALIERNRVHEKPERLDRVYVGVDPPGGATECGIVAAGAALCSCKGTPEMHGFVLADSSLKDSPEKWARAAVTLFHEQNADRLVGEQNFGGDMVQSTIKTADESVPYSHVHASRGKAQRAEPIAALYEQGRIHHVGNLPKLEDEMVSWIPGVSGWSPNRMDALVWALTKCKLAGSTLGVIEHEKARQAEAAKPYAQRFAEAKASQLEKISTNGNTEHCPACQATCIVTRGPLKHCAQCGNEWGLVAPAAAKGGRAGLMK